MRTTPDALQPLRVHNGLRIKPIEVESARGKNAPVHEPGSRQFSLVISGGEVSRI
jgi:hypothetical protein